MTRRGTVIHAARGEQSLRYVTPIIAVKNAQKIESPSSISMTIQFCGDFPRRWFVGEHETVDPGTERITVDLLLSVT